MELFCSQTPQTKRNLLPLADAHEQSCESSLKYFEEDEEWEVFKNKKSSGSRSCTSADDVKALNNLGNSLDVKQMKSGPFMEMSSKLQKTPFLGKRKKPVMFD